MAQLAMKICVIFSIKGCIFLVRMQTPISTRDSCIKSLHGVNGWTFQRKPQHPVIYPSIDVGFLSFAHPPGGTDHTYNCSIK